MPVAVVEDTDDDEQWARSRLTPPYGDALVIERCPWSGRQFDDADHHTGAHLRRYEVLLQGVPLCPDGFSICTRWRSSTPCPGCSLRDDRAGAQQPLDQHREHLWRREGPAPRPPVRDPPPDAVQEREVPHVLGGAALPRVRAVAGSAGVLDQAGVQQRHGRPDELAQQYPDADPLLGVEPGGRVVQQQQQLGPVDDRLGDAGPARSCGLTCSDASSTAVGGPGPTSSSRTACSTSSTCGRTLSWSSSR